MGVGVGMGCGGVRSGGVEWKTNLLVCLCGLLGVYVQRSAYFPGLATENAKQTHDMELVISQKDQTATRINSLVVLENMIEGQVRDFMSHVSCDDFGFL